MQYRRFSHARPVTVYVYTKRGADHEDIAEVATQLQNRCFGGWYPAQQTCTFDLAVGWGTVQ